MPDCPLSNLHPSYNVVMFTPDQYQLLDYGGGRRLERLGPIVVDRPCPVADQVERADPAAWPGADARFDRGEAEEGRWTLARDVPEPWLVTHGPLCFDLKPTPFGHVGLFPEQADNWDWVAAQLAVAGTVPIFVSAKMGTVPVPCRVLNLFAYTGGCTLAAAAAGAEVVHVDAARNVVDWARRNAALSGVADRPIRWIVEDARKFVRRELRRGNRYDAVVLDPPSYGHGPHGEVWRLWKHLPRLLAQCCELTAGRPQFMLLTCHTPGVDAACLKEMLAAALGGTCAGSVDARPVTIRAATGRELPSGVAAKVSDDSRKLIAAP